MAKLTKNEKITVALLENPTIELAAKAAEVSEATIYRRLADPDFRKEYDNRRRQIVETACGALQGKISGAVATLAQIMEDSATSPYVRVQAASTILEYSVRTFEILDIMPRLKAIEADKERREQMGA